MNKWSHLPNARYIDFVLESERDNPDEWTKAWVAARNSSNSPAGAMAWNAAWNAARTMAWNAARAVVWDAVQDVTRVPTRDSVLALVICDDSAYMLDMDYEELRTYAIISENPAAILLLPAVKALQLIKEKKNTKCHV